MKYFTLIILILIIFGCKTKKQSTFLQEEYYKKQLLEEIQKQKELNKEIYIYKDSLAKIKAFKEKSIAIVADSSYLETSYAFSFAKLTKEGNLLHSIENKDSIPTIIKYIYKNIYINKADSIYINKIDTIYKKEIKEKTITIEPSFFDNLGGYLISFVLGCIFLVIIYFLLKLKKII